MAKTLFDITETTDSIDWQRCHLIMEMGRYNFSYAILGSNKKLIRLRYHELDGRNNRELADEMEEIIEGDEVLRQNMKERVLVYNFPESQLVPEKYFHINANQELMELLNGDLNKGIILSEKISGWNQYNVFRVPADIHALFQRRFGNGKYWHYYSLWMECGQQQFSKCKDCLSVIFYPNRIIVAVIKNKQLQLVQSYAYQAAEDVSYYLLNICKQLELEPANVTVKLAGMVDVSSAMYTEMLKYFLQVEPDALPIDSITPSLEEYPAHFFSPILKLAVCVS